MVGRQRILITWAWERFSAERKHVIQGAFRIVGSLPIDGSCDHEISVKGIESPILVEGLKDWRRGGLVDDENDVVELSKQGDGADIFYKDTVSQ